MNVSLFSDGAWSDWSPWSSCSLSCGGGNQTHMRSCTNPAPAIGGKNCSATNIDSKSQPCNVDRCPIGMITLNLQILSGQYWEFISTLSCTHQLTIVKLISN